MKPRDRQPDSLIHDDMEGTMSKNYYPAFTLALTGLIPPQTFKPDYIRD
jgi:hypothetical protein